MQADGGQNAFSTIRYIEVRYFDISIRYIKTFDTVPTPTSSTCQGSGQVDRCINSTSEHPFCILNLADDLQGKPENPDRHRTRRSAVGRDGTRRTNRPLNQAENADPGDNNHRSQKLPQVILYSAVIWYLVSVVRSTWYVVIESYDSNQLSLKLYVR